MTTVLYYTLLLLILGTVCKAIGSPLLGVAFYGNSTWIGEGNCTMAGVFGLGPGWRKGESITPFGWGGKFAGKVGYPKTIIC